MPGGFKIYSYLLVFILFFSCTRYAELKEVNGTIILNTKEFEIDDIKEVKWSVGPYRKQSVSRGIRIKFNLPKLSQDNMEKLSKAGADSWLIRLRKSGSGTSQILSYFKIQFASDSTKFRKKYRSISSGSIGINFTAAAISTRLSNLNCPAFGHRKKITELDVEDNSVGPQSFVISAVSFDYVNAKVESLGYQPVTVNGGKDLDGKYTMEIALYESSSKRKRTSFKPIGNIGLVKKSEDEIIKGCEGVFNPPARGKEGDSVKQFKFGR